MPETAPEQPQAATAVVEAAQPAAQTPDMPAGVPEQPAAAPAWGDAAVPAWGAMAVPAPPKPKRPFPWRWVGAVVVTLAVGAGCAFAVTAPKRTELPGLATASDGRYSFAPLTLPTLAPGQSDPNSKANAGQQHVSDIRKLLLPAPAGATPDHSLPGAAGWVSRTLTLGVADSTAADQTLGTYGWRHTAGVAWKTPDGADTKIYLLQFTDGDSAELAATLFDGFGGEPETSRTDLTGPDEVGIGYSKSVDGSKTTWYGSATVGDTVFMLVYTAPASVGIAPFQQELDLQIELLQ